MVDNTNWYIVISTVALVVITAYYAFQTRELARRPFTPYISASFNMRSQDARDEQQANIVLDISNVGQILNAKYYSKGITTCGPIVFGTIVSGVVNGGAIVFGSRGPGTVI
jgi:hypothetical protein